MLFKFIQTTLLIGLSVSYSENVNIVVTEDFFPEELVVYEGKHDIVKLYVPLKYDRKEGNEEHNGNDLTVFFIEADLDRNGHYKNRGLYVLKHGKKIKLLDNGQDITSSNDYTKQVYFGATDGLYKYNNIENKAEKIGEINDSIIRIAREYHSDAMYVLYEDHTLFKVENEESEPIKVSTIGEVEDMVLDFSNNLYFYGKEKQPFVYDGKYVKKIMGLPQNIYLANLIRPSFAIEDGVPFIADNKTYVIYSDGSSEKIDIEFEVFPTAYSMEATLIQYYAYNRKIYEYNLLSVYIANIISEFNNSVENRYFMLSFMERVAKSFTFNNRDIDTSSV